MTERAKRIGANVKAAIERRETSQAGLARLLGVSPQAVSRRIAGECEFSGSQLSLIAERMATTGDELLRAS